MLTKSMTAGCGGAPGAVGTSPQVNNLNLTATVGATSYLGNNFSGQFSVAGGAELPEPAGDLAVAAALVSSLRDRPLPPTTVVLGEVGLAGEVRAVGQIDELRVVAQYPGSLKQSPRLEERRP